MGGGEAPKGRRKDSTNQGSRQKRKTFEQEGQLEGQQGEERDWENGTSTLRPHSCVSFQLKESAALPLANRKRGIEDG